MIEPHLYYHIDLDAYSDENELKICLERIELLTKYKLQNYVAPLVEYLFMRYLKSSKMSVQLVDIYSIVFNHFTNYYNYE